MNILPKVGQKKAVHYDYFPTPWQAFLWRTWGLVPAERIAKALKTDVSVLQKEAARMGMDPYLQANPDWMTRGYLTVIRDTWHLATYEQITTLLDCTDEKLAFLLKEDDFLWGKLGHIKPWVEAPYYAPLTEKQAQKTDELRQVLDTLVMPEARKENAFAFAHELLRPLSQSEKEEAKAAIVHTDAYRTVYSYFALYGDPLIDPSLDPFPEALLARYAKMGVKGVWMQGILYQLVEFPMDPSISEGWQIRLDNLNHLIQRAKEYDIGIYLYLNEPRSMNEAFFKKYPDLKGTREADFYALCTSQPAVQHYLEDALYRLFQQAPGLAGFFTISMSENLTNCYSRRPTDGCMCPRCAKRKPWEVVAEVNNIMARGAHRANPKAKAIHWNWAWNQEWATMVPPLFTEGQIVQCTSEKNLPTMIGGIAGHVDDYTLSLCGPGEEAKSVWKSALDCGLDVCAKVQFNNTWEMSAVPWMPVFDNVAKHIHNLQEVGIRHIQYSWTLGGWPSPNLKLAGYLMENKGSVEDFCVEWLGKDLGKVVYQAQSKLSEGFREFPFHIGVVYRAPMNYGPMCPFFTEKTEWKSSMVGYPFDDLESWRSIYPEDIFEQQFAKLNRLWEEGLSILQQHQGENDEFDDMLHITEMAGVHFKSTLNQIRFIRARNADNRSQMLAIIPVERENVLNAIRLRHLDSRFGYEASNHYFYSINDLMEKLINLDACEKILNH